MNLNSKLSLVSNLNLTKNLKEPNRSQRSIFLFSIFIGIPNIIQIQKSLIPKDLARKIDTKFLTLPICRLESDQGKLLISKSFQKF